MNFSFVSGILSVYNKILIQLKKFKINLIKLIITNNKDKTKDTSKTIDITENMNLYIKDVKKNGTVIVNTIDVDHFNISHNLIAEYFTFSLIISFK